MIWMFFVHLVRSEIRRPNTKPTREPPNATTKKETCKGGKRDRVKIFIIYLHHMSKH